MLQGPELPLFRAEYSERKRLEENPESMRERFHQYDKGNPTVWGFFERFAWEAKRAGRKKFSHWLIANRIRWEYYIATGSEDDFKLPNDYIAHFARKMIVTYPSMLGFFTIKRLKDPRDEWPEIKMLLSDAKKEES